MGTTAGARPVRTKDSMASAVSQRSVAGGSIATSVRSASATRSSSTMSAPPQPPGPDISPSGLKAVCAAERRRWQAVTTGPALGPSCDGSIPRSVGASIGGRVGGSGTGAGTVCAVAPLANPTRAPPSTMAALTAVTARSILTLSCDPCCCWVLDLRRGEHKAWLMSCGDAGRAAATAAGNAVAVSR
jgi:hypothetical protein